MKCINQNARFSFLFFCLVGLLALSIPSHAQKNADGTITFMLNGKPTIYSPTHPGPSAMEIDTLEFADEKGKPLYYYHVSNIRKPDALMMPAQKAIFRSPDGQATPHTPRTGINFDGSISKQYAKPPTCDCVIDTLEIEMPDGNFEMWFTTTEHNILVQGDVLNASIPSTVYQNPEQMPKYLNGRNDLTAYIHQKLQAEKRTITYQGPISVQLLVSQDGKVMQVICEKSIPALPADLESSIVNILLHMPQWTPAKVNGKVVDAYYNLELY